MKDFILGSEEFLIRSQEHIEEFFLSRGREEVRGEERSVRLIRN